MLELNEGQAVHSLYRPGSYLTGDYWDGHLVLPFAARARAPRRIAILGNAAGTVARAYGHFFPATAVDAVEIDAELTELGPPLLRPAQPAHADLRRGRPALAASAPTGGYDAIMVDAYRQPYIPFYLATREFFELARDRLAPGGVVIVNVGHPEGNDELERVLGRTMAEAFPRVLRYPIEPTNTLLVGRRGAALGGAPARAARAAAAGAARRSPARPPRRSSRGSPAARSTPTTAPRSSGWSTPPCWNTRMGVEPTGQPGWSPGRLAAAWPSRSTSRVGVRAMALLRRSAIGSRAR